MKRSTAIAFLLIGMLLFLGSCVPFGYVLYYDAVIDPAETTSLSDNLNELSFQGSPGTLARFTVQSEVETASVQEDPENIIEEYEARFKFPIRYKISDASGNTITSDEITMAWKDGGNISKSNEETTSIGGKLTASTSLEKFVVPADGNINLSIDIDDDVTYEARMLSPKIHLYEGMIDNTWYVVSGVFMLLVGFVMAMVGFIFTLTSSAQVEVEPHAAQNSDANQKAMIIQLSAFAGYIIPLGSIIVPLILWQVWREKDPYIDAMGKEGVNFQLSMLLYYIISFVLMFVLIGFVLIFAAMIFHLTFVIIGAVQTSRGANYRYPMILRLIK